MPSGFFAPSEPFPNFGSGVSIVSRQGAIVQPPLKAITAHAVKVLKTELYPTTVVIVDSQGSNNTVVQTRGYGQCDLPDGTERPIVIPYLTTIMEDDFGEPVDGGPGQDDQVLDFSTTPTNDVLLGMNNFPDQPNRYQTASYSGDGLTTDSYGTYPYTGVNGTHPAKSTPDRHVRKPKHRILRGKGIEATTNLAPNETPGTSTNPNDNHNTGIGVELAADSSGNLIAGLDFLGSDGNGVGINLDTLSGLQIVSNKLSVYPDGKTTKINSSGQLEAVVSLADIYEPGRAIIMNHPETAEGSVDNAVIAINVNIAAVAGAYQAGLCDTGGNDGNGLMINLASASTSDSGPPAGINNFANVLYPSFLPAVHREAFADGHNTFMAGLSQDVNPHDENTNSRAWWTAGWLGAQGGNVRYGLLLGDLGAGGGTTTGALASQPGAGSIDPDLGIGSIETGSVPPANCTGVLTGSGLTITAGDGNSLAVWLAHKAGGIQSGLTFGGDDLEGLTINLLACDSTVGSSGGTGSGLTLSAGADMNSLAVVAAPDGAMDITCAGLSVRPDGKTIITNSQNKLQVIGVKGGSSSGSGTGPPVPTTGTSCTVQPTPPGTYNGPVPPVGGSNPSDPTNAGKPGYTCGGAAATELTHGNAYPFTNTDTRHFVSTQGYDWLTDTGDGSNIAWGDDPGGWGWGDFSGPWAYMVVELDATQLKNTYGGEYYCHVTMNDQDFPHSYWEGVWLDMATLNCALRTFNGGLLDAGSWQPNSKKFWVGISNNCDGTSTWFLGASPNDMHVFCTRPFLYGTASNKMIGLFFKGSTDTTSSVSLRNFKVYSAKPGNVIYTDPSGGTTGGTEPPPCPDAITASGCCIEWLAGWDAYKSGVAEDANPYAGSNPCRSAWDVGWIDSYNYWTGHNVAGGTSTGGSTAPTAPSSVPSSPTDYRPDWQAGYNAYLAGQPQVCPFTSDPDANRCVYWNQGWVDGFNAYNTKVDPTTGAVSGYMPGGSTGSMTCLDSNSSGSSTGNPVPIEGDLNVTGSISASGSLSVAGDATVGGNLTVKGLINGGCVPPCPPTTGDAYLTATDGVSAWLAGLPMTNPMTAAGEMIVGASGGVPAKLAVPGTTTNKWLSISTGTPLWTALPANVSSLDGMSGAIALAAASGSGITITDSAGTITLGFSGTSGGAGSGSVTSVGMTGDGVIFNTTVIGSPITSSGTLAPALLTQTAQTFLAGPASGAAATPTFRAIAPADLPIATSGALGVVKPDGSTLVVGGDGTLTVIAQYPMYRHNATDIAVEYKLDFEDSGDITWTVINDAPNTQIKVTPSLSTTGVTAATYGDATHVPATTVDSKGRVTGITSTAISLPLSGLSDSLVSSPSDGQVLAWNAAAGKWENETIVGSGGSGGLIPDATTTVVGTVLVDRNAATSTDPVAITKYGLRLAPAFDANHARIEMGDGVFGGGGGSFGGSAVGTHIGINEAAISAYYAAVLTDAPRVFYRLGEASGTVAADSSGNGRDATFTAGTNLTQGVTGATTGDGDKAMRVNGGGQQVLSHTFASGELPSGSAAITIEWWFKTTSPRQDLFQIGNVQFFLNDGGQGEELHVVCPSGGLIQLIPTISDGAWHHYACVWSGSSWSVYVDGTAGNDPAGGQTHTHSPAQSATPTLSVGTAALIQSTNGDIDEIAYYPSALSTTRLAAHRTAAPTASYFPGNFLDFQTSGSSVVKISGVGDITTVGQVIASAAITTTTTVQGQTLRATGLAGAIANTGIVGRHDGGAPTSGTWGQGDVVVDSTTPAIYVRGASGWGTVGGYTLPIASGSVLGGIKIGSGLSIDGAGVVTASGGGGGAAPSGHLYLGTTTPGASYVNADYTKHYLKKITVTSDGLLSGIAAYVKGNASNVGSLAASIWTDNAGTPGTIIASGDGAGGGATNYDIYIGATGRWHTCDCPATYLTAGTYWIAVWRPDQSTAGAIQLAFDTGGSDYTITPTGQWWAENGTQASTTSNYSIRASMETLGASNGMAVNKLQLDYQSPSTADLVSAVSVPTTGWTDLFTFPTFSIDDSQSEVEAIIAIAGAVVCTGVMQVRLTLDGTTSRFFGPSATPSAYGGSGGPWPSGSVSFGSMSAGTHTLKMQAKAVGATATAYIRPNTQPQEYLNLQVIERKVVLTGPSGTLDMARVRNSATQGIASGTVVYLSWDTEDWDTNNLHSTTANTSRLTCVTAGKYRVGASASFTAAGFPREMVIRKNGSTVILDTGWASTSVNEGGSINTEVDLGIGDYLEFGVYNPNAGTITVTGDAKTAFWMERIDGYAINAKTTTGDLEYGGTSGIPTRLAVGSTGQLLGVAAGVPAWQGDTAWTAPTLTNSWVNYGSGGYGNAGYRKDADGFVHLRGLVKNGSSVGATIFTLPAGYRPAFNGLYSAWNTSGAARINIGSDGTVVIDTQIGSPGTAYQSLDGVTFLAEN
jgi:ribosome modulation factor